MSCSHASHPLALGAEPALTTRWPRPRAPRSAHRPIAELARRPLIVHDVQAWERTPPWVRHRFLRLAQHHPVLFVTDPVAASCDQAVLRLAKPHPNVVHVMPLLPATHDADPAQQSATLATLLQTTLAQHPMTRNRFNDAIQWFRSTATAPTLLGEFGTVGAIYDCADTASPPPGCAASEHLLLRAARLVLTGTQRLHELRARLHATLLYVEAPPLAEQGSMAKTELDPAAQQRWDQQTQAIRARLLDAFRPARTAALPPGFVAASALALAAD